MKQSFSDLVAKCMFALAIIGLVSCSVTANDSNPIHPISTDISLANLATPVMPDYLIYVKPTGRLTIADYDQSKESTRANIRGIVIGVRTEKGVSAENRNISGLLDRITIYVDGNKLPNSSVIVADELMPFGPFIISWSPNLLPGLHQAKIQFTTDSGEPKEYTWEFVITEK